MYIKVKATPGAKKESFEQKSETLFEIKVKERAERNLANRRIVELVARYFKIPTGKVRIMRGHYHPIKLIEVSDI